MTPPGTPAPTSHPPREGSPPSARTRGTRNGDVEAVAESLTVNGQYRPIVVTTDGTILAGNHVRRRPPSAGTGSRR